MRIATAKSKTTMKIVVFDEFGQVKRDYGVMARHHDNPAIQSVYKIYFKHIKRRWIDAMYWLRLK